MSSACACKAALLQGLATNLARWCRFQHKLLQLQHPSVTGTPSKGLGRGLINVLKRVCVCRKVAKVL